MGPEVGELVKNLSKLFRLIGLVAREFNEIRNNIDGVVGGGVTDLYVSTGM